MLSFSHIQQEKKISKRQLQSYVSVVKEETFPWVTALLLDLTQRWRKQSGKQEL